MLWSTSDVCGEEGKKSRMKRKMLISLLGSFSKKKRQMLTWSNFFSFPKFVEMGKLFLKLFWPKKQLLGKNMQLNFWVLKMVYKSWYTVCEYIILMCTLFYIISSTYWQAKAIIAEPLTRNRLSVLECWPAMNCLAYVQFFLNLNMSVKCGVCPLHFSIVSVEN